MALLTIAQQQSIKPISPNWASFIKLTGGKTNFEQLQIEVEEKELRSLLGVALLQDIQLHPTQANYISLLSGTSFVYEEQTLSFKGIRYILGFFNWSKYVSESHFADTFSGMVQKNRNESESLSQGDIKRTQNDAQEIAMQDFEVMKKYLNLNKTLYPLWNCQNTRKPFIPRFTGVKKTHSHGSSYPNIEIIY